jgi:hypothetical protein
VIIALRMDPQERAGAGELPGAVDEAYAKFKFQDLKAEHDCEADRACEGDGEWRC